MVRDEFPLGGVDYITKPFLEWDAAHGDWFPVEPSLTLGRAYTSGITLQNGVLLLGGRKSTSEGRISLGDAWWLRRRDGAFYWTQLPGMNYPRAIPIGVADKKILAFGGGEWEKSRGGEPTFYWYQRPTLHNFRQHYFCCGWRNG